MPRGKRFCTRRLGPAVEMLLACRRTDWRAPLGLSSLLSRPLLP